MAAQSVLYLKMKSSPLEHQSSGSEVGVYDCELHLKFRLIEEKNALHDRDRLLEILLEALSCGADEYLEMTQVQVEAEEIPEVDASPQMRRHLIRLRNSGEFV